MVCAIAIIIVSFYLFIMVSALEKIEQFGGLNPFTSSALFVPSLSLLLSLVPAKL